jgi:hypothetical protein
MDAKLSVLELRGGGCAGYWHLICSEKTPFTKRAARLDVVVFGFLCTTAM